MELVQDFFWTVLPLLALWADMRLGDPQGWPHPVRLQGRVADWLESLARCADASLLALCGTLATLSLAVGSGWLAWWLCGLPVVGWLLGFYLAYAGLALGGLLRECGTVAEMLGQGRLDDARRALSMLVSRETDDMSPEQVSTGLAETLSENLGDGFAAPFFYLILGGPGLLWGYKAVSTLDSMWGYKTPEYKKLGWFPARLDDVLAFLPARLTAVALLAAARLDGPLPSGTFARIRTDAVKCSSPNAGWPMAAAAWLVGAPMGGPARYFGQVVDKPALGPDAGQWGADELATLFRLVFRAGCILAAALWGMGLAVGFWFL